MNHFNLKSTWRGGVVDACLRSVGGNIGTSGLLVGNRVGEGLTWSTTRFLSMVVSPLWRGPGNIHGFILDGKSHRQ